MSEYKIFTSESVSEGHPDKMADQISDAVLDAMLKDDPDSRVACETLVKDNLVVLAGEGRLDGDWNWVDDHKFLDVTCVVRTTTCCHEGKQGYCEQALDAL